MNEELEQSEESQLIKELDQTEENRNQIIEIYKLQAQLANSISNRRITINRFYILVISGLVLIFPAFFRLPAEIQNLIPFEFLVAGMAFFGINLSLAWFILVNSNLRVCMLKYEALKRLEEKLEYQFFKDEWEFLYKYGRGKSYWEISYVEIIIPILFFLMFALLQNLVSINSPDKLYSKLAYYPSFVVGLLSFGSFHSWQIDKDIRGMKRWTNKKIRNVSFVAVLIFVLIIFLFRSEYRKVTNKGLDSGQEKPAEKSSEKTATEQIVLPDEKQVESTDENSIGEDGK